MGRMRWCGLCRGTGLTSWARYLAYIGTFNGWSERIPERSKNILCPRCKGKVYYEVAT